MSVCYLIFFCIVEIGQKLDFILNEVSSTSLLLEPKTFKERVIMFESQDITLPLKFCFNSFPLTEGVTIIRQKF